MSGNKQILFSELVNPTERQKEFFKAMDSHKYVLYGGAKGGGKSYILRWACVRQLVKWASEGHLGVRAVIFCEDYPSLKDRQVTKINTEFPPWLGTLGDSQIDGLSFRLNKEFGGGIIALRNLDDPSKYASSEFALVVIDEITKNKRDKFDQLRSIIRWPGIENTKFIAGTNPGDIGHAWVKKLWIDRDFRLDDPEPDQVMFVKSLPTDNPHNAATYLAELQKLPDNLRKAYWEGNWDVFEGQFFTEWDRDKHTCEPFTIPNYWRKFRSIDVSGRHGITSCHWYAVDPSGDVWVYREHYGTGLDADEHAMEIIKKSPIEETYDYTVIDSAAFSKVGLPETVSEVYERNGVTGLIPSSKERIGGWNFVHQYLRWTVIDPPRLHIFKTCGNMIRTIPLAIHDDIRPEDVDTDCEDHAIDELRYFLQTLRGRSTPEEKKPIEQTASNYVIARLTSQSDYY
jgi:phage terminase large subunit